MPTIKDEAIVLRLIDWSETSQIVVLLTREHGKISGVAKGAKRRTPSTMAKFSGGLELATRGEAVLIVSPKRELANLTEWELTDGYWHIRRDLRAFELAMYAVDLGHHLLHDHDPHPRTFEALGEFLSCVGHSPSPQPSPLKGEGAGNEAGLLRFQWTVITDAGFRPVLEGGGGEVVTFSAREGGVKPGATDGWKVRRETIELLKSVEAGEDVDGAPAATVRRANQLLCAYCRALLDKQLPTMPAVLEAAGSM